MRGGVKRHNAIYKNLLSNLVEFGSVTTNAAWAKPLQARIDRLITYSRKADVAHRRLVARFLREKKLVNKLVDEITPGLEGRTSGFTRVIKVGKRMGDRSMMSRVEFVELKTKTKVTEQEQKSVAKELEAPKTEEKKSVRRTRKKQNAK